MKRRGWRAIGRNLACLLLAGGLMGCETLAPEPVEPLEPSPLGGPERPRADAAAPKATPVPPIPRPKPGDKSVTPAPPTGAPEVEELLGWDFSATQALLGDPVLEEVQAPARIWTYNGERCVLRLFFFPEVGSDAFRLLTYEATGEDGVGAEAQSCLESLFVARRAVSDGTVIRAKI
jgi:hypothetical protein